MIKSTPDTSILRGVAQLVARLVRDQEVAGSNPAAPNFKGSSFSYG